MSNKIRELQRKNLGTITLVSGDSISLEYNHEVLVNQTVDRTYIFTEGVLFEADAGVFGEGKALGGAFVE